MSVRTYTLEEPLYLALRLYREAQKREPSRERALVITKLEEAALWNDADRARKKLPALGLEYQP